MDKWTKEYFIKYKDLLNHQPPKLDEFYSHIKEHFGESDYDIFTSNATQYLYNNYSSKGDSLLKHLTHIPEFYMKNDPVEIYSEVIPENIKSMGMGCYIACSHLEHVVFNKALTIIGDGAFSGCNSLDDIIIPSNIKVISKGAFEDCYSLTTIEFNEGLKSIDNYAFDGCKNLTEFTLPKSLNFIGHKALPSGPKVTVSVYRYTDAHIWAVKNDCKINYLD